MGKGKSLGSLIGAFLEEKKAEDVLIIDMEGRSAFYDEAVLGTAPGHRALEALSEAVVDHLEELGYSPRKPEGTADSGWILVDAGDAIIHLFVKEKRESLSLETVLRGDENPKNRLM